MTRLSCQCPGNTVGCNPEFPCPQEVTQEDGLCDDCRRRGDWHEAQQQRRHEEARRLVEQMSAEVPF